MRLTKFTDYVLRVLILAGSRGDTRTTVEEAAARHGISQTHLKKVVAFLAAERFITTTRGHHGGFVLARPPAEINLGQLLRKSEPDFALFPCQRAGEACVMCPVCTLPRIGQEAAAAFLASFDRYTLADLLADPVLEAGQGAPVLTAESL